jgi:hypothetical protein
MTDSHGSFTSVRYSQEDYESKIPFVSTSGDSDNRNLLCTKSGLTSLNDAIVN